MKLSMWIAATTLTFGFTTGVKAVTTVGPLPYLSIDDTPGGIFSPDVPVSVQDFESEEGPWQTGFDIACGMRIGPGYVSGGGFPVTDSVDGDDGEFDGSGLMGGSWFCPSNQMTIAFREPVDAAGFVFTDGDRRLTNVRVEFQASDGSVLSAIDGGDFVDDVYTGTTEEDRFFGHASAGIASISISIDAGNGMEIDHIQYQAIPEPATGLLAVLGLLLARFGRGRR